MTHDELKELLPIYALDALPAGEEAQLEAHVSACRECSALLAEHRDSAASLALSTTPLQPSQALRDRILAGAAQARALAPERTAAPVKRRPAWRWGWQGGLAAGCLLAVVVAGIGFLTLDAQTDRFNRQQQVVARQRAALELIGSPDAEVLAMAPPDPQGSAQARGRAFVDREGERATVVMSGLTPPGDGVYTMWTISGGDPARVSDFIPEDGVAIVPVGGSVTEQTTLAVTREPRAGNTEPEGPIVLAAAPG